MIASANARTFQYDLYLPALPYPNLKTSLVMYLDLLDAIVPTHIFLKTKETIERFAIEDSYLLELNHKKLKYHCKNWLEEWWMETYHLTSDTELIPFGSIVGFSSLHERIWMPSQNCQIERAAKYLHGLLTLWACLRHEIIVPEKLEDGEMLSMNLYRNIFNAARIPGIPQDNILRYFKTRCEGDCPTHILVSISGYTFKVTFIEDEHILPLEKIIEALSEMMKFIEIKDMNTNLSPVTALPKSQLLAAFAYGTANNDFFECIKTSILWLGFDNSSPPFEHLLMAVMGCDPQDRCGLKSFSMTVFANGLIGLQADSALLDPIIIAKIIQFVDQHIIENRFDDSYPFPYKYEKDRKSYGEVWNMFNIEVPNFINNEIFYIRKVFAIKAYQLDCSFRHFKWFNLKLAKSWRVNPCITVHMLILLTYWEIHQSLTTSCAVVSHRRFYRGREDVVPTLTVETINWIKAVMSKQCSSDKLKILFLLAHKKILSMFDYCENNCGPFLHLNLLNSFFDDTSRYLKNLCNDQFWHQSGFSDKFGIKTYYLGEHHIISILPPTLRLGLTFSYSVTEESTLLTVVHRCYENEINPRFPRTFLKEFLTSTEILNQIFND